jgi:hypothetical protein
MFCANYFMELFNDVVSTAEIRVQQPRLRLEDEDLMKMCPCPMYGIRLDVTRQMTRRNRSRYDDRGLLWEARSPRGRSRNVNRCPTHDSCRCQFTHYARLGIPSEPTCVAPCTG